MADIDYSKINWQNEPSHNTPLSAENLNKMDTAIYDLVTKSNSLVPNPVSAPTEGLEKLEYDGTVYEVKGGHKILNDSGSVLTQMDNMQFNGVYTHNASTITEVDIVREFSTVAEIEALTGEAKKGFQARINGNSYEPFKATDIGFNKTGTSFTSDDVDGVLREVDDSLNEYSNTSQTMTGISVALARKGQLKYLRFSDNGTSSALNSGELLGTISNALYRPSAVLDIRDTYSNMRFTIETDGTIVARQNISSGTIIRGSFMYF